MADSSEGFEECLQNVLCILERKGFKIRLNSEQEKAISHLYEGKALLGYINKVSLPFLYLLIFYFFLNICIVVCIMSAIFYVIVLKRNKLKPKMCP